MAQENTPMQAYTDPFQGVPRVTPRRLLTNAFSTVLGPVPSGHAYIVTDVDCSNQDTLATGFAGVTVQDNGAGHVFSFRNTRSIAVGSGVRFPDNPVDAGGVHHYRTEPFHMEFDDIFQMLTSAIPTAAGFMVKISYTDIRS